MASVTNNDHVNIYATISDSVDDPLSRSRPPDVEAPTLAPTQEKQSKYAHGFTRGYGKKVGFASLVLLIVIPVAYVFVAFSAGQSNEIVPGFSYNASRSYSALLWKTMKESLHIRVRPHGTPPHQDIVLTTTVRPLRGTAIDLPYASKKLEHLDSQNTSLIINMTAMPGVQTEEADTTPSASGRHSKAMVHGAATVAHYRQLPSSATSAPPPSGTEPIGVDTDRRAFSTKTPPMGDPQTPRSKPPAVLSMMSTPGTSEQRPLESPKPTPPPKSPTITTTTMPDTDTEDQARAKLPKDNPALLTTTGQYPKDLVQGAVIFTPYRRLPSASAPPPLEMEPNGVDTDPRAFSAKTPPMGDPQTPRSKPPAVLTMISTPGTSEKQPLDSPKPTPPPKPSNVAKTTMPGTHTEDLARTKVRKDNPALRTTTGQYPKGLVQGAVILTPCRRLPSVSVPPPPEMESNGVDTDPRAFTTTPPWAELQTPRYKPLIVLAMISTTGARVLYKRQMTTKSSPPPPQTEGGGSDLLAQPPMISDEQQQNTTGIPRNLEKANEKERKCSQHECFGGQTVGPTQTLADKTDHPYFSRILSEANLPTRRPKPLVFLSTPLSNGSSKPRNSVDSTATSLGLKRPTITRKIPGMHAKDTTSDPSGIFKTIWTTGHYPPYKTKAHNQQMQTDTTPTPSKIGEAVPYHHPPDASTKLPEVLGGRGLVFEQPAGTFTPTNDRPLSAVTSHTSDNERKDDGRSGSNGEDKTKGSSRNTLRGRISRGRSYHRYPRVGPRRTGKGGRHSPLYVCRTGHPAKSSPYARQSGCHGRSGGHSVRRVGSTYSGHPAKSSPYAGQPGYGKNFGSTTDRKALNLRPPKVYGHQSRTSDLRDHNKGTSGSGPNLVSFGNDSRGGTGKSGKCSVSRFGRYDKVHSPKLSSFSRYGKNFGSTTDRKALNLRPPKVYGHQSRTSDLRDKNKDTSGSGPNKSVSFGADSRGGPGGTGKSGRSSVSRFGGHKKVHSYKSSPFSRQLGYGKNFGSTTDRKALNPLRRKSFGKFTGGLKKYSGRSFGRKHGMTTTGSRLSASDSRIKDRGSSAGRGSPLTSRQSSTGTGESTNAADKGVSGRRAGTVRKGSHLTSGRRSYSRNIKDNSLKPKGSQSSTGDSTHKEKASSGQRSSRLSERQSYKNKIRQRKKLGGLLLAGKATKRSFARF